MPVVVSNDLNQPWQGPVALRLMRGERVVFEQSKPDCRLAPRGQATVVFDVAWPKETGAYVLVAELRGADGEAVHSVREMEILDAVRLDLAYQRPVTASSTHSAAYRPENAVDDDPNTYWSSEFKDGAWLAVDLGAAKTISRARIAWEQAFARAFSLQVSLDGKNWTNVYATEQGKGGIDEIRFAPVAARHVRLLLRKARNAVGQRGLCAGSLRKMSDARGATPRYSWSRFRLDLIAGLTVAAIAVPQAMAYALIAGIDPRYGLYSAIVVTAVASIFGSSSYLINGPTNAISLVTFSALAFVAANRADAVEAMFLLAVMAGGIQILVTLCRLGDLTRYISVSVVIGFMAGAGLLIALTQVGNLLGLKEQGDGHQHLLLRLWLTLTQGGAVNPRALAIGLGTAVLVVLRKVTRHYQLPRFDMLLALGVAAAAAALLGWSQSASQFAAGNRGRRSDPCGASRVPHAPLLPTRLASPDVGQCPGRRLPGPAGGLVDRRSHLAPDPPAAGLQSAMPGRGAGQLLRRVLPMPARFRLVDPLGDQLPGRRGNALVGGLCGRGSGPGGPALRPAGKVHSQGGPGGHPAGDRGRPDRSCGGSAMPCGPAVSTPCWCWPRPCRRC